MHVGADLPRFSRGLNCPGLVASPGSKLNLYEIFLNVITRIVKVIHAKFSLGYRKSGILY